MTIGDIVAKYPKTAPVLLGYGLHCVGCAVNPYETLEQGALGHGMSTDMIRDMLGELNMLLTKKAPFELHPDGITLSPRAIETLKAIAEAEGKKNPVLQVQAKKQTGGIDYFLDLLDKPIKTDVKIKMDGVTVSKPLSECGCKNGEGCSCDKGGCC
jgi:hybrid cluster-associated redox disulfide protein